MDNFLRDFEQALLSFDKVTAKEIILLASETEGPSQCIEKLIVPALVKIGEDWEIEKVALSQVYMSSKICEELVDMLIPEASTASADQPKMAIAVLDDHHSLGKRTIYSSLRATGFLLDDWGTLDPDELVAKTVGSHIQILLLSVLMLPSALAVKDVAAELRRKVPGIRIVVGGAPFRFDKQLWQEVGADATADNASEAIELLTRITKELP